MWQLVEAGAPVVRDVLSLAIGGLGVFLAYLAIKLGKEQAQIADKQTAIAEKQDRIMHEQLARRAVICMSITQGIPIADGRTLCRVYVHNNGTRGITGYKWEFMIA